MPSKKSVRPKTGRSSRQSTRTRANNSGNRSSIVPQREVTKISTYSPVEPAISNCIGAGVPMDPEENSQDNGRRTITKTIPNGSKRARLTGGGSEAIIVPVRNYGSDREETVDPVIQSQLHTDQEGGVVSQPNGNAPHQNTTLSRRREPIMTVEVDEFRNAMSDAKSIHEKHTHLKGSLVEALRDKRVITAACLALKAKCDEQEKELMRKTQHISVLEASAHSRVRKGKKSHVEKRWSLQDEDESSLGHFEGIGLALRVNLTKKTSLLVTESYFDDDHGQLRDCRGSLINVSTEIVAKTVMFVLLQDGTKAIPSCGMIRALKGVFYDSMLSRYLNS